MANVSKRRSYIELMIERHHDININSDPDNTTNDNDSDNDNNNNAVILAKKPKHRWCWLRPSTSSSPALAPATRFEIKLSFTVQGVHSFLLKTQRSVETHNILHGGEAYRSATLDPTQSGATWRSEIGATLAEVVPPQLVDSTAAKLQRDLAGLRLPASKARVTAARLVVVHVHIGVKVVTPDRVTPEMLLNRVSAVSRRRAEDEEEDCVICLEGLDGGGSTTTRRMLVCSHVFHGECLLKWLLKKASCPVCWSRCLGLFFPRE